MNSLAIPSSHPLLLLPRLLLLASAAPTASPSFTTAWLAFLQCGTNPSTRSKVSMSSKSAIAEESKSGVESAFRRYTSSMKLNRKGCGVAIMWFRNDLRIIDNEALFRAWNSCEALLPVYCLDPRMFSTTHYFGFPKTGELRAQFLLESLADLRTNLQQRGLNLLIKVGRPENILPTLASTVGAHTVFAHKETCSEEVSVEKLVRKALEIVTVSAASNSDSSQGLQTSYTRLELIWGSTLYHLNDLPFTSSQLPDVFTAFRKAVEFRSKIRACIKMPASFAPSLAMSTVENAEWGHIPTLSELGLKARDKCPIGGLQFFGGERAALSRVHHYFWEKDKLRVYKETRNGMLGADYSTKLSPWLALGCISPRYIYEEVKRYEQNRVANDSTYWVVFELIWRDYFRFISIKYGNAIFHLEGPRKVKGMKWSQDPALFEYWQTGRTGYPLVDANMKELMATGFMSNRGRQIVCSFLVRDMGLDWRMGAEWFETCLLDYDPCSNYGNWTYGAGVGNDPREDRYFSIPKQAQSYDPDGEYVAHWIPELAKLRKSERHFPGPAYIKPVVPLKFSSSSRGQILQPARQGAGKLDFRSNDRARRM